MPTNRSRPDSVDHLEDFLLLLRLVEVLELEELQFTSHPAHNLQNSLDRHQGLQKSFRLYLILLNAGKAGIVLHSDSRLLCAI